MIQQFDKVTATFHPKRTDDLRPETIRFIGRYGEFRAGWLIEDGQFRDQWAMSVPDEWLAEGFNAAWVPESDLVQSSQEDTMLTGLAIYNLHAAIGLWFGWKAIWLWDRKERSASVVFAVIAFLLVNPMWQPERSEDRGKRNPCPVLVVLGRFA